VSDGVTGVAAVRLVLVTDRSPARAHARLRHCVSLVLNLAADGGIDEAEAENWKADGWPAFRPCGSVPVVSTDVVRGAFDIREPRDAGWAVIAQQREALLAPTWQNVISVLCAVLVDGDRVVADVAIRNQGALEVAADIVGCTIIESIRAFRPEPLSRARFWLGEMLGKGLCGRGRVQLRGSPQVLVYAETPNHWRQLGPIVAELKRRGVTCAFLSAAVGGLQAFVPPMGECEVISLDRRALSPRALVPLLGNLRRVGRACARGEVSGETLSYLQRRAEYARWVYEKAFHAARGVSPAVGLFGDASAHRPAGVAESLRAAGATTVTAQHGAVVDAVRYSEMTEYVFVWDDASATAMQAAGSPAVPVVIGVPTAVPKDHRSSAPDAHSVLLAPTAAPVSDVLAWLEAAARVAEQADGLRECLVRLHPSMTGGRVEEVLMSRNGLTLATTEDLAETLARVSWVITRSHSVAHEARLSGLPVAWFDGEGAGPALRWLAPDLTKDAEVKSVSAQPAALVAADWIESRLHDHP